MNVLITGGSGYVAGRLAQYLCSFSNTNVVVASRQSSISFFESLPEVDVCQLDWESDISLSEACKGIDVVIHAAGMAAAQCAKSPVEAFRVNAVGTGRLLQEALKQGVKRFLFLSTAHVYASPLVGTINEQTPSLNLHPYASSNRAGEDLVRYIGQLDGIESVVVRLSNVFGVPINALTNCWHLVVNNFCRQAVINKKICINSSGLQRRDFISMSNASRALHHLMYMDYEKLGEGVINVGGSWSPTIKDVACMVRDRCQHVLGFAPDLEFMSSGNGEEILDFKYETTLLTNTDFELQNDVIQELDNLLLFCQKAFCYERSNIGDVLGAADKG